MRRLTENYTTPLKDYQNPNPVFLLYLDVLETLSCFSIKIIQRLIITLNPRNTHSNSYKYKKTNYYQKVKI